MPLRDVKNTILPMALTGAGAHRRHGSGHIPLAVLDKRDQPLFNYF